MTKKLFQIAALVLLLAGMGFAAPTANAGSPQSANAGTSVSFDASASSCSGCTIVSYNWNFDDGSSSTGIGPSHSFSSAGTYSVVLVVVDNSGNVDTDAVNITVSSADATPPTITHTATTSASNSSTIPISATITDNVAVQSATLYYKNSASGNNSGNWSYASMTASGNTYSAEIPLTSINVSGVMYYVSAVDTSSNTQTSPANASQSNGSSVNAIAISGTDTTAPTTTFVSVNNVSSSPFWFRDNSTSNIVIKITGESGMTCRIHECTTSSCVVNYSSQLNYGGTSCSVSSTIATCTMSKITEGTTNFYVGCADSGGNVQPVTSMVNVSLGIDMTVPPSITNITAYNPSGFVYLVWNYTVDGTSGVSGQRIYRSSDGENFTLASTTSANASTWVDTSPLSSNFYSYKILSFDAAGNNQTNGTNVSLTVQLVTGWNLVGITQNLSNTTIASVVSSLNLSNVEKIIYFDGTSHKSYIPNYGGTLSTMEAGKSYWIKSRGNGLNFNSRGGAMTSQQITLNPGWNQVSFVKLFNSSRTVSALLTQIQNNYSIVKKFNPTTQAYSTYRPGDSEMAINSGDGFWIFLNATAQKNLTVQ